MKICEKQPKRGVGRPKKFSSAKKVKKLCDEYFENCKGKVLTDEVGQPVMGKNGYIWLVEPVPPTVTGLALHLGFTSRQALLNYEDDIEFFDTIRQAKMRVEEYAEKRLFDKEGVQGAKFSLANNFKGWSEKAEVDLGNKGGEAFKIANDEAVEMLEELGYIKVDAIGFRADDDDDS